MHNKLFECRKSKKYYHKNANSAFLENCKKGVNHLHTKRGQKNKAKYSSFKLGQSK